MENIIVALSNFTACYPIIKSYLNKDYITCACLIYVTLGSFFSHLFECHKHGMSGLGLSKEISYLLNRIDVSGAIILSIRLLYLYYNKFGLDINIDGYLKFKFVMAFIILQISEYDKYNPKLKHVYIMTHCIWHILIFLNIDHLLDIIY